MTKDDIIIVMTNKPVILTMKKLMNQPRRLLLLTMTMKIEYEANDEEKKMTMIIDSKGETENTHANTWYEETDMKWPIVLSWSRDDEPWTDQVQWKWWQWKENQWLI